MYTLLYCTYNVYNTTAFCFWYILLVAAGIRNSARMRMFTGVPVPAITAWPVLPGRPLLPGL